MDLYDADCFVGRWPTAQRYTDDVPALGSHMERLGIGRALVRHTWGWHYDATAGNERLLAELAGHSELRPCLAVSPLLQEEMGGLQALLDRLGTAQAGAICLYPRSQSFSLAPWSCGALLEAMQAIAMPVILECEEVGWDSLGELLANWPRLPVILANTGYRVLRYLLPLLRRHANLHVSIAYLGDNQAIEAIGRECGFSQLLFGTGTPRIDGGGTIARLAYSQVSEENRAAIASGNLERLLAGIHYA
jgi:hypothetical protein